jgi:hypothetical protein
MFMCFVVGLAAVNLHGPPNCFGHVLATGFPVGQSLGISMLDHSRLAFTCRMHACRIVLTSDVQGVGKQGEIKQVPLGYWRNFLLPNNRAQLASDTVLE